jgi:hypothetical protein
MKRAGLIVFSAAMIAAGGKAAHAQTAATDQLTETGKVMVSGRPVGFLIRRLPASSFPELPAAIAAQLTADGCMIPQTYEAHRPENVVRASLERAGSADWAVLCAAKGTVALLVFFASEPEKPMTLATAPETERLQAHDPSGVLGFNWGIDPASPQRVHEAQLGMKRRAPLEDHDALSDSTIENRTVFHYFTRGRWTLLDVPE